MLTFEFRGGPLDGDVRPTDGSRWFRVVTMIRSSEDDRERQEVEHWYAREGPAYVLHPLGPEGVEERCEVTD